MEPRYRGRGRLSWRCALVATYLSVVNSGTMVFRYARKDVFFALSTASAFQPRTASQSSSGNRCSWRCRSSAISSRYHYIGVESWRCTRPWRRNRFVEHGEQRLINRCSGTSGDGHVSKPAEGIEGTQQERAWKDTTAAAAAAAGAASAAAGTIMNSRGISGVRLHNSIGLEGCRKWQSPRSGGVNHEELGMERVRGVMARKSLSANDVGSCQGGDLMRREGNGEVTPCGEIEGELRVPRHVAFVMDGNGRWATNRNMPRRAGHVEGAHRAGEAVEACRELGVEFVTLYAFSTENWSRPVAEVSFLMELMERTLLEQRDGLRRNGIRLTVIGEVHRLPPRLRSLLSEIQGEIHGRDDAAKADCAAESVASTGKGGSRNTDGSPAAGVMRRAMREVAGSSGRGVVVAGAPLLTGDDNSCDGGGPGAAHHSEIDTTRRRPTMTLCLAISYGGRAEVARAARELAEEAAAGGLDPGDIDEEALGRRLSTARLGIPDPDLVVRTSGESRLSNLLLWQAAYSELCVVSKAWPEFRRPDLVEAFRDFGARNRRYGKTPDQISDAP